MKNQKLVKRKRYVEGYLEYFKWDKTMKNPSVTEGFTNPEERNKKNE